jgi:hypothetical protein
VAIFSYCDSRLHIVALGERDDAEIQHRQRTIIGIAVLLKDSQRLGKQGRRT